ncbi:MAG: cation transporter [Clostridia bacterium]|nr:cation transporter [Clostridia bacterium]MBO7273250.1 cation transporter [Clostridia bacterium]
MTKLLIKLFVKDYSDTNNRTVRQSYGTMTSIVGIIINFLLFVGKFAIGTLFGSVAISADAINNLSDAGSSFISLISFKISSKPADREHPFGHARIEYIASMAVGVIILLIGFDLLKESFFKILTPSPMSKGVVVLVVLLLSIMAKLWLGIFYRSIAKKINSEILKAASADSFSDVLSTGATLISALVWMLLDFNIDAYVGLVVSIFILIAGLKILNENKNIILGSAPDPEIIEIIKSKALEDKRIIGIHDLMVHSYGAGATIASFHAEVDGKSDFFEVHDLVDNIEKQLFAEYNITCTIHLDPVVTDDEQINALRGNVENIVKEINESFRIHDFRCVVGPTHTNLIFDIEIPFEEKRGNKEILSLVEARIKELDATYFVVASIDRV